MTDEVKGALRGFADDQRKESEKGEKIAVDVYQFENETSHIVVNADLDELYRAIDRYATGGCTALYDAVCTGIDELGAFFAAMAEDERPESVLFVIVTDGYENASRRFSNADVQRRVKLQAETYSWKFVFLAKGIDSEEAARDIGIDKNMAVFEDAVADFSSGAGVRAEMSERMANVRQSRRKK